VNNDSMTDHIPTLVLTAGLDHSMAAGAVEADVQGPRSKTLSMPETVEAVRRLTGLQEG
jgi:DNA-binding NarL/FixJ family response regulator